jgi:hypothetical protein
MNTTTINKTGIYQLLDIKPDSTKMLLLIIPPIYALWLLAIGKKLLKKKSKSDNLFTFFGSVNVLLFTYIFIFVPIIQRLGSNIVTSGNQVLPLIIAFFSFWFVTIGFATNLIVKHEREVNPDYNYTLVNIFDYVFRFFALYFWPFTIWSYQKKVNEYNQ